jgi:hypothetical protein
MSQKIHSAEDKTVFACDATMEGPTMRQKIHSVKNKTVFGCDTTM